MFKEIQKSGCTTFEIGVDQICDSCYNARLIKVSILKFSDNYKILQQLSVYRTYQLKQLWGKAKLLYSLETKLSIWKFTTMLLETSYQSVAVVDWICAKGP